MDEDKQREIPQICNIYRDVYVTIIAASSQKDFSVIANDQL